MLDEYRQWELPADPAEGKKGSALRNALILLPLVILWLIFSCGSACSSILAFLPINTPPVEVPKKGLQLVGLSKWSTVGTTNCRQAIIDSACKSFEFSYCPFFNVVNPFGNADILNSIPISITETVFLGWRNESVMSGDWGATLAVLSNRAAQVNVHVNEIRGRVAKIVLVPVLEDYWSDTQWMQAVQVIASQLDSGTKIFFRRSHMLNTSIPPESIVTTLKNGTTCAFTNTALEAHKIDFGGSAQVISNDGGFVFQSAPLFGMYEDASSLSGISGGYATTGNWFDAAKVSSKTAMLWRPAYNLWSHTITYRYISYKIPSVTLDQRFDNEADPFFNMFEAEIVKQFLNPATH
ncbi:MAG: hypothetical protein WC869_15785 [Phycisphaerae bacterium]|jgi:hypothetical protein